MSLLGKYIANITPKFNKPMVEGICYHKLNYAIEYIDTFIRYSVDSKTSTNLRYLGYEEVSPKDEVKFLINKSSRVVYDVAENDLYLVKFMFSYGEEEEIREYYFYLPFLSKGNIIRLSGNRFLVMPTLADKVISVGERVIFINILTAKYNFTRHYHSCVVNGNYTPVPVITTELYKNQVKKLDDTTKASSTVIHYLLANHGYTETMKRMLGFVPTPTYDTHKPGYVVIGTSGLPPKGYIGDKELYTPTKIHFAVKEEQFDPNVSYVLGNLYYLLDNFPDRLSADSLDDSLVWKRLMGEIIHSGNHGIGYLSEKMYAHFNDLNSNFDALTKGKLKDIGVNSTTLMELLEVIFLNFNKWIMNEDSRSLYHNKTYEVESFVLSHLTSRITRISLDINKEELRIGGKPLEKLTVDKIFKKYFATRAMFGLKKDKRYVTSIEYSGDHLYFKSTSMIVQQESDFINVNKADVNTSERSKIVASMATVGSILGLSKKNPTPLIRLNPYVNTDYQTGTILPHPEFDSIIKQTDMLLSSVEVNDDIDDISEFISDFDEDDGYEDDQDFEQQESFDD